MTTIEWHDYLDTGNETVDSQHRELFRLFNELHDSVDSEDVARCYDEITEKLREYVLFHFAAEEDLMSTSGLDGSEIVSHLRAHRALDELTRNLEGGCSPTAALSLITLMHQWLIGHIEQFDRRLAEQVRSKA
jgi:hemerythrin-like metal-binding protein